MKKGEITEQERLAEYRKIQAEYLRQGPEKGTTWATPTQFGAIFSMTLRWVESNDPAFMDKALIYCHDQGLPILPRLMSHIVDAVKLRQTWEKAEIPRPMREGIKNQAFRLMANLIARGIKKRHSSEVAAVWTADVAGRPIKASTLEKEYNKSGWPSLESDLLDGNVENDALWLAVVNSSRPITDDERGNRRQ